MNEKEKETVKQVKKYLMELRKINLERLSLTFEIEDIPSPQSIKYSNEAPGGFSNQKENKSLLICCAENF